MRKRPGKPGRFFRHGRPTDEACLVVAPTVRLCVRGACHRAGPVGSFGLDAAGRDGALNQSSPCAGGICWVGMIPTEGFAGAWPVVTPGVGPAALGCADADCVSGAGAGAGVAASGAAGIGSLVARGGVGLGSGTRVVRLANRRVTEGYTRVRGD